MKPVNLTVHRNTVERRKRREASKALVENAKRAASDKDIDGYVLVTWDGDLVASQSWRCGKIPQSALPDFARGALQRRFGKDDTSDLIWGPEDAG